MQIDKIINNLTAFNQSKLLQNDRLDERFNVILVYTIWICSIIFSFFYFMIEEIVIVSTSI